MAHSNSEAEQVPPVREALAAQYRAIGPAALAAALLCAAKKGEEKSKAKKAA